MFFCLELQWQSALQKCKNFEHIWQGTTKNTVIMQWLCMSKLSVKEKASDLNNKDNLTTWMMDALMWRLEIWRKWFKNAHLLPSCGSHISVGNMQMVTYYEIQSPLSEVALLRWKTTICKIDIFTARQYI